MIKIWINNVELDLSEDFHFPITFSQADVKKPEKRKRDASKTITMPGTQINNTFFSSAYDLNISNIYNDLVGFDFDPTLRYPCYVTKNGKPIFRGSAHLQKVVTKKDVTNGRINSFDVVLYSSLANIFQALGDIKVSELGWSDYDETLTVANQEASWVAAVGSGIWWPVIDFGFTSDQLSYKTNDLRPYVYIKEIVEKCLEHTGYTLSSTFYDSALIKKIVWGYGGGEPILLSPAEIASRRAHYTGDGLTTYIKPPSFSLLITSFYNYLEYVTVIDNASLTLTPVTDPTAQFNTSTGEIVVANSGSYSLRVQADIDFGYSFSTVFATEEYKFTVVMRIMRNFAIVGLVPINVTASAAGTTVLNFDFAQALECNTGDVITTDFEISTFGTYKEGGGTGTLDITFDFNNTLDYDFTALNVAIVDGDAVEVSRFLPEQKAVDFLNDQITMFNLYMTDPDEDNVITMLPEADYFFDTDDVDQWSDKLARDQPIEIAPAANIEGKVYRFRWAEDRDYFKKLYFDEYGKDYGDFDYDVPSTFKKGEKIYQLKSAQSVPVLIEGSDMVIPRILQLDESTQVTKPHKGKPRMFFNNGLVATSPGWDLVNSDTGAISAQTDYPQANHLDDLTTATFDLNFGRPEVVYCVATTYTDDNMFYRHHAQFIRQLTGRDSKVVNAWFRLRETDFYPNFMRRLCNIDGVQYRKNLVKDWIANTNMLVKVELLKILEGNSRGNYVQIIPVAKLPPMSYGGEPDVPITEDGGAKSSQMFYQFNTTPRDITYTLDADTLRPGWRASFKKVSAPGKLTLTSTGGGAPGTSIDGDISIDITGKNDSVDIYFDGQVFKIV